MTRQGWSELHTWSRDEIGYLEEITRGRSHVEIKQLMEGRFGEHMTLGRIKAAIKRYSLNTGRTGRYAKGHAPANKGTKGLMKANSGTFGKGHVPVTRRPIGSERVGKDGYIWVKVASVIPPGGDWRDLWKAKHKVVWEQMNGPIPEGHYVCFANGDITDVHIENLTLVTRAQHAIMNRQGFRGTSCEAMETAKIICDVKSSVFRASARIQGRLRELENDTNDTHHGTQSGYQYGCRCDRCREANRIYQRESRARRRGEGSSNG